MITTPQIHQLVTRHLAEIETAIGEACEAGMDADLILPLKGARNMYRRWLAAACNPDCNSCPNMSKRGLGDVNEPWRVPADNPLLGQ